jgi:chromosome segregation ATPase
MLLCGNNLKTVLGQGDSDQMPHLKEHLADIIARSASATPGDNVVNFAPSRAATFDSADVLDLVFQAADAIKCREDRAAEIETRAQALAQRALDELQNAKKHIEKANRTQRIAEARAADTFEKIQALERTLKQHEALIATSQAKLLAAERHSRTIEARAQEAEHALARIEDAIRKKLLRTDSTLSTDFAAVA